MSDKHSFIMDDHGIMTTLRVGDVDTGLSELMQRGRHHREDIEILERQIEQRDRELDQKDRELDTSKKNLFWTRVSSIGMLIVTVVGLIMDLFNVSIV